jgi:hypothetical protein
MGQPGLAGPPGMASHCAPVCAKTCVRACPATCCHGM